MKSKEFQRDINIAIIDDELMNLKMIGFIVKQLGYGHTMIQHSLEALETLKKIKPDLILLDVQMPHLDGFELCNQIKKTEKIKDIPIIFITGMTRSENKIKGLELGGVDYVTKPFNPLELKARVKTHIELSMAKRKVEDQALKLQEDIATKNKIFSIIGHDLRSPLSAAKLKMDFIMRGIIDPKKDDFIEGTVFGLLKTMDESLDLLQNLLGWGKSESNQIEIIPEHIDVYEITEQTIRLLRMGSEHKRITLSNNVQKNCMAFADINTIKTVLRNLISNAIKFTPQNGEIKINSIIRKQKVYIEVEDNGEGITQEDLKKIINPNEHFSKLGTDKEPGTGLGLILCQNFIHKNGGSLKIKSELGKGSTFYFDIPLAKVAKV